MGIDLDEMVENIAKGDRDAFTALYRHLFKDVVKIAYVKVHDYHTAQDIAQETFVRIWTKAGSFHRDLHRKTSARAWIFTIARNLVVDHWRARKHEIITSEDEPRNEFMSQRALDMLHERMDVYALIETLPRKVADVVVLHALGTFTVSECAAHLHISTATVKRRYRAGMELLMVNIRSSQESSHAEAEITGGGDGDEILA